METLRKYTRYSIISLQRNFFFLYAPPNELVGSQLEPALQLVILVNAQEGVCGVSKNGDKDDVLIGKCRSEGGNKQIRVA